MNQQHHKVLSGVVFCFVLFFLPSICCVLCFMAICPCDSFPVFISSPSCIYRLSFSYFWKMHLLSDHVTVLIWDLEVSVPHPEVFENNSLLSRFNITWEKSAVRGLLRYCPKALNSGCSILWCWWSMKFKTLQKFTSSIKLLSENKIWRLPGG